MERKTQLQSLTSGRLLDPINWRPVSPAQPRLPLCQQHVREMTVEENPGPPHPSEHRNDRRNLGHGYEGALGIVFATGFMLPREALHIC